MYKVINIGLADDHTLIRQGMINLLKDYPDINTIFDVGNGIELLEALKTKKPDIVLLDIEMPIMSGDEVFEKIKTKYPAIKVIIVSSHFKDSYVIEFIRNGVSAFLSKNSTTDKIVSAIRSVYETGHYYDSTVATIMARAISNAIEGDAEKSRPDLELTYREIQVIRHICLNKTTAEIAKSLSLSIRTVEWHRSQIWKRTGCKNPTELTSFAIQNNLISIM